MKKEAEDFITAIFCKNHNIDSTLLKENLKSVAYASYAPYLLFAECLKTKKFTERNNPIDGLIINMIHRTCNTFGSMISLITTGHLQDAEILSRTLTESSLTIQYLLKGDPIDNFSHYLASYFNAQNWKNEKWQSTINNIDIHPHKKLIEEKNEIENGTKEICKIFIEMIGGKWPIKPRSATVDDMFKVLHKEIEYRTVYRAMCSQTHQNPEDLINSLTSSLTGNKEIESKANNEKHSFSIFICLWGTQYFLQTLAAIGKYFNFQSVQEESKKSLIILNEHHINITQSMQECTFPDGWAGSTINGI